MTLVRSTESRPAVTLVAEMVRLPVTPAGTADGGMRLAEQSSAPVPACEALVTSHTQSTAAVVVGEAAARLGALVELSEERLSGAGAGPSMKWKSTNGPPTTTIATMTPHRSAESPVAPHRPDQPHRTSHGLRLASLALSAPRLKMPAKTLTAR